MSRALFCVGLAALFAHQGWAAKRCPKRVADFLSVPSTKLPNAIPNVEWKIYGQDRTKILAPGDYIYANVRHEEAQGQSILRMGFISRIEKLERGDVRIVIRRQVSSWKDIKKKQLGEYNLCYEFRISQLERPGFVYDFTDPEFEEYISPLYLPVKRLSESDLHDRGLTDATPSSEEPLVTYKMIEAGDFVVFKDSRGRIILNETQLHGSLQNYGFRGDLGAWVHHVHSTFEPAAGFRIEFVVTNETNYIERGFDHALFTVQYDPKHSYILEDRHINKVPRTRQTWR